MSPASNLGPWCVGVRVVVRHVVRGSTAPSGRPLLSDVLGVLEEWHETSLTIRTEDGSRVVLDRADLVAGKPVPPRPSVRQRVRVRDAELRAIDCWPPHEVERLGDWVLRAAGGFSRRANSALLVGRPDRSWSEGIAAVERFYRARGQRPLVQVLGEGAERDRLSAAGWQPVSDEVLFQIAGVAAARRAARALLPDPAPVVDLDPEPTDAWLADDARALAHRCDAVAVLTGPAHAAFASVSDSAGRVVAKGRAALSERADVWVGLTDLWVAAERRRERLGTVVVATLLGWAAEHGASTAYLQVTEGNIESLALYVPLGFRTHHTYCYLGAPLPAESA